MNKEGCYMTKANDLKQKKFTVDDVLIMTADNSGSCFIADKNGCTYTSQIGGKKNDKS